MRRAPETLCALTAIVIGTILVWYSSGPLNGVGISLGAAGLMLAIDVTYRWLGKTSIVDWLIGPRRLRIYSEEGEAFNAVFCDLPSGCVVNSVYLLNYTADMGSRDLQRYVTQNRITVRSLKLLIRHPTTLAESIEVNHACFPGFPRYAEKGKKRRNEIDHTLTELSAMRNQGIIQSCEIRGYYGIPCLRAVILNRDRACLSIYIGDSTGDDVSGTTDVYILLSKQSRVESASLENLLNWFDTAWGFSTDINGK
jgi:hypothetical protein